MSKISKDGLEQIQIIKNALDSMFDKLDKTVFVPKGKLPKNVDGSYNRLNIFQSVKDEFEAIAGIVESTNTWDEISDTPKRTRTKKTTNVEEA
tara:strand:+ start:1463 stop:1741 length:279 start_codon:yes stop_codon:yes gene_type:complete